MGQPSSSPPSSIYPAIPSCIATPPILDPWPHSSLELLNKLLTSLDTLGPPEPPWKMSWLMFLVLCSLMFRFRSTRSVALQRCSGTLSHQSIPEPEKPPKIKVPKSLSFSLCGHRNEGFVTFFLRDLCTIRVSKSLDLLIYQVKLGRLKVIWGRRKTIW